MESTVAEAHLASSFRPYTKAERILQLNDIDKVFPTPLRVHTILKRIEYYRTSACRRLSN